MAQRRMIHEKMMSNPDFGALSSNAKILYIFCIVIADDDGRLKANAIALRGRVFPFNPEILEKDVRAYLNEIVKNKLVIWYKVENEYFIQHPNWSLYQTLRTDRKKKSNFPSPDDNQMTTNRGRSKEVSKKDKRSKCTDYFTKLPEEDIKEFLERFDTSKSKILSKAESFFLYCKSNDKWYADPKAALLNAIKKDFEQRPERHKPQVLVPEKPQTEEDKAKVKKIKDEIDSFIKNKKVT